MNTHYLKMAAVFGLVIAAGCNNTGTDAGTATSDASPSAAATAMAAGNEAGTSMDHSRMDHAAMGHTMGTSGVNALKSLSGEEFEIAYLSQMIAHHEAAVDMAKQALKTASEPQTKQDAQKVVDSQSKEIAQMTGWLKQWHGVAPSKEQQALVNADMQGMMAMPVSSDAMYYAMMIPHHQGAIDMSELVPTRSQRPELKQFAKQIIRDQKAEIATYQPHEQR